MLTIPPIIAAACEAGAALAISISGGKDSQALLNAVSAWHRTSGYSNEVFAIHADLGRTEWPQTAAHVEAIAAAAGVPLVVVRRAQGDLLARWEERMAKLAGTGKPFWSSAQNRYCTSDLKRGPINQYLRRYPLVISVEGIRADESAGRARKPVILMREGITASKLHGLPLDEALDYRSFKQRLAFTWNAIHEWSKEDVWAACGTSSADLAARQQQYRAGDEAAALAGWAAHPAYVLGNERLSCALCILASKNDLRNGAKHNPALYARLVDMEQQSGYTFRADMALSDLFN
jgi:3'-phosphoadenosine 5'-phosphosulfate sulfotransferase (PAPS reductase)/FAD synthetase